MTTEHEIEPGYIRRLSEASRRKSFDPYRDIDWSVPFDSSRFYVPADLVSLYDTDIWRSMSREDQVRLSLFETASTLASGIWFENILNFKLIDYLYDASPYDEHFYWMQQEVGDECRHSMMFAEVIRRSGTPWYPPKRWLMWAGRFTKYLAPKAIVILETLIAEAVTDHFNRRIAHDPECHPIMRQVARIHMIEEARHLGYARHWLRENYQKIPGPIRAWVRSDAPIATWVMMSNLVHPKVYSDLNLPAEAATVARKNPARRVVMRNASAELVDFLRELEVIDARTTPSWRRLGLIA